MAGRTRTRKPGKTAALLYHNVGAKLAGTYPGLTVAASVFARHMETLARRGYTGMSAREWWRGTEHGQLPPKPVILSFDDGYGSLAEHAFPVLRNYGFTATVFVVTNLAGGEDEWLRREGKQPQRLLGADQIRYWAERGIEFGAHSATHADLTQLAADALQTEVAGSRSTLETLLKAPVTSFAYPYGFYNQQVVEAVRGEYQLAFTVEPGTNDAATDRHLLRRTMVAPTDGAAGLLCRSALGRYPVQNVRARLAREKRRLLGLGEP